jgi:hypothetical protein
MLYVIVMTDEGEIPTRIARSSVVEDTPPHTYVEAALQQHPVLLSNMVKLCKQLAECKLDGSDEDELRASCSLPSCRKRSRKTKAARLSSGPSNGIFFRKERMIRSIN